MTPERERPTRRQVKEGRPAQQAADRLAREADRMEQRSGELGAEIEQARSDWQRKRADQKVPGANPPEGQEGAPEEASFPGKEEGENGSSSDGANDENGSPEDSSRAG
jgi:hypothetical protein